MQSISAHHPEPEDHGAILPTRLEWLCGPEQIEQTLHLLYYLNSWRRANQQLLYADRQGLHEVQALVLEQATRVGAVQVAIYVDGTARFPGELLLESAAENAARGVLIHIKGWRSRLSTVYSPSVQTYHRQRLQVRDGGRGRSRD